MQKHNMMRVLCIMLLIETTSRAVEFYSSDLKTVILYRSLGVAQVG